MNKLYKAKREEGFTIIEVLIVLAIAGLIILIVFLAVPALQRNSRNTQRNNDAALILSAINECLANRNGQAASCDSTAEVTALDATKIKILSTQTLNTSTTAAAASNASFPSDTTIATVFYKTKCNSDGATYTTTGTTDRQFAVLFNTEDKNGGNVNRCIDG